MQSERTWLTLRTLAIITAVAALPTILLFVVSSQAGLALLAGLGVAWLIYLAVSLSREHPGIGLALGGVLALIAVLGVVVGLSALTLSPGIGGGGGELLDCPNELVVTDAAFVIDGSTLASGALTITGEVNGSRNSINNTDSPELCGPLGEVPLPTQEFPARTINVTERGFTLSEASFQIGHLLETTMTDFDTVRTFGAVITIELRNFPRGSFYQARGVNTVESSTYLDTETIKWSPPEDEVTFSFIRPGYAFTRPVVDLMYGAQTFDTLAVGAVGSLGTLILGTVVEVVIGRFVKKPLESMLDKKGKKRKT